MRSVGPRLAFVAGVVVVVLLSQLTWTASPRPARAAEAGAPAATAGLVLTFAAAPDGPAVDAATARLVALSVPADGVASPMLKPGPFAATWSGLMATPRKIKEDYRFTAQGTGTLKVTINGKPVLDLTGDLSAHPSALVTLRKAKNKISVTYQPPGNGPADVRLLWARDDYPDYFSPVPPTVFTHDPADAPLVQHGPIRVGRDLLATMRCIACHQNLTGTVPELAQDAPNLTDVQRRLRPAYLAKWIADPKSIHPTTDMPRVLHGPDVDQQAADVAAYLSADAPSEPPTVPATPAAIARGGRLFTSLGCVACHVAPAADDSDPTLHRISLNYVKAKFRPEGLAEWLRAPEAHFAWVKMPNFHLSDGEVSALSAWLVSRCKDDALPPAPAGDAGRGKALFASAGCMSCHASRDNATPAAASAVDLARADWNRGCTADKVTAVHAVDYAFAPEQVAALRTFTATDWKPTLAHDAPADFAARQMTAVRCNACHHIDGVDSAWLNLEPEITALEATLPPRGPDEKEPEGDQSPPPLTWAGEKLRTTWAASFIGGHVPYKPRSWVVARMPSYASRAAGLAAGLAQQHGIGSDDAVVVPADAQHAEIGRDLTGQTRFGCVKCHAAAGQAAIAPFEAFAPNLAHVTDRLRHDYYARWMRNPQVYLPGTKMPTFGNGEGKTPYKEILGGDAAAEYEAIWSYLLGGEKIVPAQ